MAVNALLDGRRELGAGTGALWDLGFFPGMMVIFSLVGSVAAAHGIEAALQSCIGSQLWL